MKNFFKNQKGVSLISLVVAVVIILILTNIVIYNVKDNLGIQKLKSMQTDIANLRDKVSSYYATYGNIPANTKYTNTSNINVVSQAVDTGDFYVIDLEAMENLTLTYGKDYEKIRTGEVTGSNNINRLEDLYIINEDSHNIFYVKGIELDGEKYYTDYTSEDVDKVSVSLHYVDNVKIPEGFYYVAGTKDTGLVISDVKGDDLENSKKGNQFVWIPVEKESDYVRNTSYENVNNSQNAIDDTDYLPDGITDEKRSVIGAGGFYVARYETGKDGTTPVSKKEANVWTNIAQEDCKTEAKKMVNTNDAKTALCSGVQWDMVMQFVDGKMDGNNEKFEVRKENSNRHRQSSGVQATGQNVADKVCNIFDLEGNAIEYVAESPGVGSASYAHIVRGGSYSSTSASSRLINKNDAAYNDDVTFRVVLYVMTEERESGVYDKTAIYKDKNEDTAMIPAGFQVSKNQGEDIIQDGLVVIGPDGSEFVWVPVNDINDMVQCSTAGGNCKLELQDGHLKCTIHDSTEIVGKLYATGIGETFGTVNTTYDPDEGLREPAIVRGYDNDETYNTVGLTLDGLKNDYKLMAESVAKYGGFYVGRYEMSLSTATLELAGTSGTVQSKAGAIPTAANNSVTNRWYGLYSKAKTYVASGVQSSMIWGSQYDAMLNWVKNTGSSDVSKIFTPGIGNNSSGSVTTTGNDTYSNDSINHIRDLGGNLIEWTLEAIDVHSRVRRGGSYNDSSSPSDRINSFPEYTSAYCGSRLTLYIQ